MKIKFVWNRGRNIDQVVKVMSYKEDTTVEEIQKDFEKWVWSIINDDFTWYEDN